MMRFTAILSRSFVVLLLMGMMLSVGSGYAYSSLKTSHEDMIRIAYTNGYKDALEYTFETESDGISKLESDYEHMKKHVISASKQYIDKVVALNYAK